MSSLTLLIRSDIDVSSMSKGELVDLITTHETAKSAAAAVQARAAVELLRLERAEHPERGVALVERSVGTQVALARKDSPLRGRRHLSLAKALCTDLPYTMDALERGELSEYRAHVITRETNHLTSDERRTVDHELSGGLSGAGDRKVADLARAAAHRADPEAAERRAHKARSNRWVGAWAKPDAMMMVKALLPFEQGLAVHRALRTCAEQARRDGDKRPIGQVMADEFVQRLLGKPVDHAVDVEIQLVMNERTLLRGD
ncbi:MAG: 13E12 repeat family protein, partial [Nocardiaceae bacterium]|nr:13E12 repeat family protein [Nocardiaceae bacterium]